VRVPSLLLTAGALLAVFRLQVGMIPTLAGCAGLGVAYYLLGGSI
jgi:chromate transporter